MLGRYREISAADTVDGNGNKDTIRVQLCAQKHACIKQHEWTDYTHTADLNISNPLMDRSHN